MLCNSVKELPVTLDEVRGKAKNDAFIKKKKMQVMLKERNKNSISAFSICDDVFLYADASHTSKENFEGVSFWASKNFADEELDAKLYTLTGNRWRY